MITRDIRKEFLGRRHVSALLVERGRYVSSRCSSIQTIQTLIGFLLIASVLLFSRVAFAQQSATNNALSASSQGSSGFVVNAGQVRGTGSAANDVRYCARSGQARLFFRDGGFSYVLPVYDTMQSAAHSVVTSVRTERNPHRTPLLYRLDCEFVGANAGARIESRGRRSEVINYVFEGNTWADVASYDTLVYRDLYPGIDVCFRMQNGMMKYDVIVHPGASLSHFAMRFADAREVDRLETGDMRIVHDYGELHDAAPTAIACRGDDRSREVAVRYVRYDRHTFGFACNEQVSVDEQLVIDPAITWATYFGGRRDDEVTDAVVNNAGFLIVCGWSLSDVFPGAKALNAGDEDMFISKFNSDRTLNTTTYFGGPRLDIASGIAVDSTDNVFIAGQSMSQDLGFANNVFQWANSNPVTYNDAVVVKFSDRLQFVTGTFIGGGNEDIGLDVATDATGNVIVVGNTYSDNYPTTPAGLYTTRRGTSGDVDAFIVKWTNGLSCLWSTYYGGRGVESATSCSADEAGNVFVGGWTRSGDFPNLDGFQKYRSGDGDGFILKLTAQGYPLNSTLFGGGGDENIYAIDFAHDMLVATGYTSSGNDLPAFGKKQAQDRSGGLSDGFIVCTDRNLGFRWSTYWGGSGPDVFYSAKVCSDSAIVITGYTGSPDMPLKRSIQLPHSDGIEDIVVAKFSKDGVNSWSTVIGGKGPDVPRALCVDRSDNMYVVGSSKGTDFPVLRALYPPAADANDGIVMKLCPTTPLVRLSTGDSVVCEGGSITLVADPAMSRHVWNTGERSSSIVVTTAGTFFYSADSPLGCTAFSDTVRIYIRQKTSARVNVQGKSKPCVGDSVLLFSPTKFDAYSWRDEKGVEIGKMDSVYVRQSGVYHMNIVDRSGCYDSSKSVRVDFAERPALSYSYRRQGDTADRPVTALIQECEGTTVMLSANTGGLPLFWSNGASTSTLAVTSAMRIQASVTDQSGCVWNMDTISVQFDSPTVLTVGASDTVCVGSELEAKAIPKPGRMNLMWDVDGGVIKGTADSGTIRIVWNSVGMKTVRVGGRADEYCLKSGEKQVVVIDGLKGRITSPTREACPDESVTLRAPSGYSLYLWNGTSGDSLYAHVGLGQIRLEYGTTGGCLGRDTLVITNRSDIRSPSVGPLFDTLQLGSSQVRFLSITQQKNIYVIGSARLRSGVNFRLLNQNPPVGSSVAAKDSTSFDVMFQPLTTADLFDTLDVFFTQPCRDSVSIPLRAYALDAPLERRAEIRIRDTTVSVQDTSADFPIYAVVRNGTGDVAIDSARIQLGYSPRHMRVRSIDRGEVRETIDMATASATAEVRIPNTVISSSKPSRIGTLRVCTMLGPRREDSLNVLAAEFYATTAIVVQGEGAKVQFEGICYEGGTRQIGQGNPLSMTLRPHPVTTRLDLVAKFLEKGSVSLSISDVNGRTVLSDEWTVGASSFLERSYDVGMLPKGLYVVSLRTPTQQLNELILIEHAD